MTAADLQMPANASKDIFALGAFIERTLERQLSIYFEPNRQIYQRLFEEIGDMAYGKFNALLFLPVRHALKSGGLKAVPRLPGSFQRSREWGNENETHQQRWMTSKIICEDGTPLGTIAVGSHHDHTVFRLPRAPEIIALKATSPKEVVAELSTHHAEFADAEEFRDWYAKYLAEQASPALPPSTN